MLTIRNYQPGDYGEVSALYKDSILYGGEYDEARDSEEQVGPFLYKLHAMTKTTPEECLKGAKEHLGIEQENGEHYLNWPMKFILTRKRG